MKEHSEDGWMITADKRQGCLESSQKPTSASNCSCSFLSNHPHQMMLKDTVTQAAFSPLIDSESSMDVFTDTHIFNNYMCIWKYLLQSRFDKETKEFTLTMITYFCSTCPLWSESPVLLSYNWAAIQSLVGFVSSEWWLCHVTHWCCLKWNFWLCLSVFSLIQGFWL